ncbi:hypothetical protein SteCoe_20954 [Stentor coeruleus]|uniref:DUF4378 domain-containing protein n=1 Tax=Stentor coeruleus TaxID=5963 RepID=A0A1R2BR43_9CILI|nr:hypothetical protein SteCoe_20954 [Stentor coeruleus]
MHEESFSIEYNHPFLNTVFQDQKSSLINQDFTPNPCEVLGRKINSIAMIIGNEDSTCKYPLPVQVTASKSKKYNKSNLQDISNKPVYSITKQKLKSKTPEPHKTYTPKPHAQSKKVSMQKPVKKTPTAEVFIKSAQKKTKIFIEIPQGIKEDSVVKKNINLIVMQTLKKPNSKKKQAEKSKNEEKEHQNIMKKQLNTLNHQTRIENFRFKQEKFSPKCPWGVDERKITKQNDMKVLKEAEEIKKKRKEERERSKSAGKSRIGLDAAKVKKDNFKPKEETIAKKPNEEKDKSIARYMKRQKKKRRKSKDYQREYSREYDKKRFLQLQELEKIAKKPLKRLKSSKLSRKRPKKKQESLEVSQIADSEDIEAIKILHKVKSKTPDIYEVNPHVTNFDIKQSGRERIVFEVFPDPDLLENKGNSTQIVNDIAAKRLKNEESLPQACITMPLTNIKETYSVNPTKEDNKENTSSDISRRKDEIRKKLLELKTRVDRAKNPKSENLDDKRTMAAVKIQAWVRGFLTRLALHECFNENTNSADYDWNLENNEFEESSHNSYQDSEVRRIMKQKASASSAKNSCNEHKNMNRIVKKQQELEKILRSQSEWREIQKKKLTMLKNKDLEDMKMLAKKVGSEDMLMKYFVEIIERRYLNISQIFDENVEAVVSALHQAIEDDNTESLLHTLERQENFVNEMFQNLGKNDEMDELMKLKQNIDFNSVWSYSENEEQSVRISELDYAFNSRRSIQNSSNSSELILESVHFPKAPKSMQKIILNSEPERSLFIDDFIIRVQNFICDEVYAEAISDAWDSLLTCSAFINDVAERILCKVLSQESDFLGSFDMFKLKTYPIEKKQVHRGVDDLPMLELRLLETIGIDMNEEYLSNYLSRLFDCLSSNAKNIENILNTSQHFKPLNMLKMIQEAEIGVVIEKNPIISVLPLNFYTELEKDSAEILPLQKAQLIYDKLLFSVVNEALSSKIRKSDPYPWIFGTRVISYRSVFLSEIATEVTKEVKQLNKVRTGKIKKIDFISYSNDSEEDIIQQIYEEQLSSMIAKEIIDQEPSWINYEFEETQIKLDLADMTLEELVEETIKMLKTLTQ